MRIISGKGRFFQRLSAPASTPRRGACVGKRPRGPQSRREDRYCSIDPGRTPMEREKKEKKARKTHKHERQARRRRERKRTFTQSTSVSRLSMGLKKERRRYKSAVIACKRAVLLAHEELLVPEGANGLRVEVLEWPSASFFFLAIKNTGGFEPSSRLRSSSCACVPSGEPRQRDQRCRRNPQP